MASPRALIQIVTTGTRIVGKAFYEAGRQALKNAQHRPQGGAAGDAAGVSHATSGSVTDKLTRDLRMTLDEAHLILNTKRTDTLEAAQKHYEHLFKANSPPPPPEPGAAPTRRGKAGTGPIHSHYLQSKVVRALERIRAEARAALEVEAEAAKAEATGASPEAGADAGAGAGAGTNPPPPPPP